MRLRCGLDSIRGTAITYAASGVVVGHVAEELNHETKLRKRSKNGEPLVEQKRPFGTFRKKRFKKPCRYCNCFDCGGKIKK